MSKTQHPNRNFCLFPVGQDGTCAMESVYTLPFLAMVPALLLTERQNVDQNAFGILINPSGKHAAMEHAFRTDQNVLKKNHQSYAGDALTERIAMENVLIKLYLAKANVTNESQCCATIHAIQKRIQSNAMVSAKVQGSLVMANASLKQNLFCVEMSALEDMNSMRIDLECLHIALPIATPVGISALM